MLHGLRLGVAMMAASGLLAIPMPVLATTLQEALIEAYSTNPALQSGRASLRAQDEGVAQARAGLFPTLGLNGSLSTSNDLGNTNGWVESSRASLVSSLMLFDGGQTVNAIRSAENAVMAAQANLRAADQGVLLQAAVAYMDVRRDQRFYSLGVSNVELVRQQVLAMNDRFAVGAVTRVEVSMAEARLAAAKTNLAANSGALALSKEVYRAIVGSAPTSLQSPPRLPELPQSVSEAESIAMREHPSIISARFNEKVAEYDLARARAARAPTFAVQGAVNYTNGPTLFGSAENTDVSISLTGNLPIFQGGALSSATRSAAEILAARKASTQDTMRAVRQATASAWANIRVSNAAITAARLGIDANQVVFDGMSEEVRLGSRTTLDLLDAEQKLLEAKSNLTSALRDRYVASFNLLSAMGLLTVDNLNLGIPAYDPAVNFNRVKTSPLSSFAGGGVLNAISDRWK